MSLRALLLSLVGLFSLSIVACGPPPLEDIEKHLDQPPATVDLKLAAKSYLSYDRGVLATKLPGMSDHGKVVSFLVSGERKTSVVPMQDYLVQSGVPGIVAERLLPYLPVKNDFTLRKRYQSTGEFSTLEQSLPEGECVKVALTGLDGSFRVSIDLGCAGEGSGRISIDAEAVLANLIAKEASFKLRVAFANACDKSGNCVDGAMLYKVGASATATSASAKMLMSMALRVTRSGAEELFVKQGIRVSYDGDAISQNARLDVVAYVKDDEKREQVVVLSISNKLGLGFFEVRGKGGVYICQTNDRGQSGSCYLKGKEGAIVHKW